MERLLQEYLAKTLGCGYSVRTVAQTSKTRTKTTVKVLLGFKHLLQHLLLDPISQPTAKKKSYLLFLFFPAQ